MPFVLKAALALCVATGLYLGKHVLIDATNIRAPLAAPVYTVEAPRGHGAGAGPTPAAEAGGDDIARLMAAATIAEGADLFRRCATCHRLDPEARALGPHLFGVVGRPIAGVAGYGYSEALAEKGGAWDFRSLSGYLAEPRSWAPGTSKTFPGLPDPAERAAILVYLNAIGPDPAPIPHPSVAAVD